MEFFGVEESRISVVYQGCHELFWKPVEPTEIARVRSTFTLPSSYVLCVGALEERKNQKGLIEAMASAKIAMPLVLVGRGNAGYKQELYAQAKRYGVDVRVIENAALEDLPAIYHMASVFAYPSLFEGFGIPILEAVRCGVPVVASTGTCFEEIAGEGALYVSPTDPEAIGAAIRSTLDDSELTQKRIGMALHNTERFRAEHIARSMMDIYQSLV
jgi:glycosyltransferase involved in cell wall biosynthesis